MDGTGAMNALDSTPSLSILMVNWNTREMTLACLRSLFEQTRETSFEVIMVDNDSKDGSAEAIAREFPMVRLLPEKHNHGFAKATNMAADVARGEYFLLLNTDTVVLDGAVDKLMAFSRQRPEAKIWGGRTLFGDGKLNPNSCFNRITPWSAFCLATGLTRLFSRFAFFNPEIFGKWARDDERQVDIVSGCFLLIKADDWRALGGFDLTFYMYGEESDLCARARARGALPRITPEATIIHYGGASNTRAAKRICYLHGARIGLIQRQFPMGLRKFGQNATVFAVGLRATLFKIAALIKGDEGTRANAREWGEAWSKRAVWRHGPVNGPL